jgi:glycosyltransferase involved in cell wall biosynthesis
VRVAFIGQKGFPATWGGVEVHVDEVARRLAARGHDVLVFNRRWYAPRSHDDGTLHGVNVVDVPSLRSRSLDAISHSLLSTLVALRRNADVFHYQCMGPSLPAPLPRLAGKAVVCTIHGYDYRASKWGPFARFALHAGERIALTVPHSTVVVAEHERRTYAARNYETIAIPNGVAPIPYSAPEEIGMRWELKRHSFLLFLARLEPDKRAHILIDAFQKWKANSSRSNLRLVVAGPFDAEDRYCSALRSRAGADVLFVGEVFGKVKAELLGNALAVVCPSRFEGLPIGVLEGMSAGAPLLLSDIPAHRELIRDGAGIICDAETADNLAGGIDRVAGLGEPERQAVVEAARKIAARYSWDDTVTALERVYESALCRTRSAQGR